MSSKRAAHEAMFGKIHSGFLKKTRIDSEASEQKIKTSKQLERHLKGVANHWRIEILFLVARREGITLDEIASILRGNPKTISEHTRRLTHAGLLQKKYIRTAVAHSLSPYGKIIYRFLKSF